ncbi:transcription factor bHLH55-like [Solanum verrucosum]|uniref:transcription factor bHLH55-like n=1 Tax=Solanum verrucosum TaxID=315347 RepID=UPI0020D151B0|nr:transcription factor bHLH55-like [Solanum verrucosum]
MDNNYLWEIFTNNKQNISEDHVDHHHHLLQIQIPNFQLNGFSQQDNQDLIKDHVGSSVITSQFQTSCDQLYKSSTVNTNTSTITPQLQTSSDCLCKSSFSTKSTITPQFQTSCDRLYKSSVNRSSTSIITPAQLQTSCDRLYKSSVDTESTNLDRTKEGLRSHDESNKLKKAVHRNTERHRRQEMANRVTSLRSLIPIEFIKGKRSASDHMHAAVNYIKYLQKNIRELDNTRKKIISLDDQNKSSTIITTFQQNNNCITVNKCEDGMEILINVNNSHKEEIFSLSKVLRWLLEQGLNVVSCDNSKQDERTLIRIQCQVSDISSGLTVVGLQKKLTDVIN